MARRIAVVLAMGASVLTTGCPEFTANDTPTFESPPAEAEAPTPAAPQGPAPTPVQGGPNAHVRVAAPPNGVQGVRAVPTPPPNVRVIPAAAHGEGAP